MMVVPVCVCGGGGSGRGGRGVGHQRPHREGSSPSNARQSIGSCAFRTCRRQRPSVSTRTPPVRISISQCGGGDDGGGGGGGVVTSRTSGCESDPSPLRSTHKNQPSGSSTMLGTGRIPLYGARHTGQVLPPWWPFAR